MLWVDRRRPLSSDSRMSRPKGQFSQWLLVVVLVMLAYVIGGSMEIQSMTLGYSHGDDLSSYICQNGYETARWDRIMELTFQLLYTGL